MSQGATVSEQDPILGSMVGSYRVVRRIGEGGMGTVYLGEHPEIQSKVAIKVLLPKFVSSASIVRRFLDEARAVNRVDHQGIVRIHDSATQEGLGVYLVMEFLDGITFQQKLKQEGPLPPLLVARLVQQAASALKVCHQKGIIHRDLKPANLFIINDPDMPGGMRVKILDFGIAKLLEDQENVDSETKTGMVIGSPLFMAPEQCLDSKCVDERADIYALGAIAYQLISGAHPYHAETLGKLILKQQSEKPRPLRVLKPEVPEALSQVIAKALEPNRDERWQSMDELWTALRQAVTEAEAGPRQQTQPAPDGEPPQPASPAETTGPQRPDQVLSSSSPGVPSVSPSPGEASEPGKTGAPTLGITTMSATASEKTAQTQASQGRGRRLVAMAGALAVLSLGVTAFMVYERLSVEDQAQPVTQPGPVAAREAPAPATLPAPAPAAPDAASPAPAAADAAAAPTTVTLTLTVQPPTAEVLLDGKPASAGALTLPRGTSPLTLRVLASGHEPDEQQVVPDQDRTITVELKRQMNRPGKRPGRKSPSGEPGKKPASKEKSPYFDDL